MKVVISGSFRRHLQGILNLKDELEKRGITVLKPDKIQTLENPDRPDFVKFEGEEVIPPLVLEMQYLKAIRECDAHIIYNKDSYLGNRALRELGYSKGCKNKKYFLEMPDLDKMIACKNEKEEMKQQEIRDFCEYLLKGIEEGKFRVGIDQLYKDFNIEEPKIAEIDR